MAGGRSHKHRQKKTSFMFQSLHEEIERAVSESLGSIWFHDEDNDDDNEDVVDVSTNGQYQPVAHCSRIERLQQHLRTAIDTARDVELPRIHDLMRNWLLCLQLTLGPQLISVNNIGTSRGVVFNVFKTHECYDIDVIKMTWSFLS